MAFDINTVRGIIEPVLKKALIDPMEEARSSYTPTSQSGKIRQWVEAKIAALVPGNAASILFVPQSGLISTGVAITNHFRRFGVDVANFSPANEGRQNQKSPYDLALTVEVGYPATPHVKVGTSIYYIGDLKSDDDEQIDGLLRGEGFWTGFVGTSGTASGAVIDSLEGAYDIGNTIRRHRYVVRAVRTWP